MFVKETKVKRGERAYTYVQLVEGYRDERGRVRHRVVANLGRKDQLKESGQLEKLAGSFARLDPPLAGTRREVGALLLAWHFVRELDVVGTVDRSLPRSERSELSVGEVCAALVASRLCSPSPLYDLAGWAARMSTRRWFARGGDRTATSRARCARCRPRLATACRCICAPIPATPRSFSWSATRCNGCCRSLRRGC